MKKLFKMKLYFYLIIVLIATIYSEVYAQQTSFPMSASEVTTPVTGAIRQKRHIQCLQHQARCQGQYHYHFQR